MVSKEQFINGVLTYADREILPVLSTAGKWGIGTIIILAKNKSDIIITELMQHPIAKTFGVINSDGLIDCDSLFSALRTSAERYGKLQLNFPLIGTLTFSCEDVDKLHQYMNGGVM